ncbi:hypothetical protein Bca52824_092032 [Brassica carinata]|uniref:Uncharacterized protein n=1 Tax=Brassica carinata TaxID=52824 RepID=A0A8X7NTG1_BRACI|nr:hypothetical protein Bca52824_092032 [Brassica carinata]
MCLSMVARASSVEEPRLKPTDVVCRLRLSSFWRVSPRLGLRREVVYGLGSEPFVAAYLSPFWSWRSTFALVTVSLAKKLFDSPPVFFYGCFFIDPIWFRLCRSASLVLRDCPCRDFLIRWVIRLRRVSCFHVFEHVIPALEPSAWSLCVLVDVLFRLVRRMVLRSFLRLNNCSVLVMREF